MKQTFFKLKKLQSPRKQERVESNLEDNNPLMNRKSQKIDQLLQIYEGIAKNLQRQSLPSSTSEESTEQYIDLEIRDKHPLMKIPKEKMNNEALQQWTTDTSMITFSTAFNHFLSGKLTYDQTKSFCSMGIIKNLLLLSQSQSLTQQEVHLIDQHLKLRVLPYAMKKYPLTEEQSVSRALESTITQVNDIEAHSNDYIAQLNFRFTYRENGNYNDLIMQTLNSILSKLDQPANSSRNIKIVRKTQIEQTNFQYFQSIMQELFSKVEDKQWMQTGQPNLNSDLFYSQKVREYTHWLIGRKLSSNVELFSQEQIESMNLRIKHPGILRLLTKWCEELWQKFSGRYMQQRTHGVRVEGGRLNRLYCNQRASLDDFLQNEGKEVNEFQQKLQINASQILSVHLQRNLLSDNERHIPLSEKACGKTAAQSMLGVNARVVLLLNRLIHGLLKAARSWHSASGLANQYQQWRFSPQLLSWHVGDLLRCKCSSKEAQIIKIYQQLERMGKDPSGELQIVRVKNRLRGGTKDILINIRLSGGLLAEVQLGVTSTQSPFINCSNSFSHYLYELERSISGPIGEMSSIWMAIDPRNQEFAAIVQRCSQCRLEKDEIEVARNQLKCKQEQHDLQPFEFPFECSICGVTYYHNNYVLPNLTCTHCLIYYCHRCHIAAADFSTIKIELMQAGLDPSLQKHIFKRCLNRLPSNIGLCIPIQSKVVRWQIFKNCTIGNFDIYLGEKENRIYPVIDKSNSRDFIKNHIVFEISSSLNLFKYLQNEDEDGIMNFEIDQQLRNSSKFRKTAIYLNEKRLKKHEIWQRLAEPYLKDKQWSESIQRLQIAANGMPDCSFITQHFPNIEELSADFNELKGLEGVLSLSKLKRLALQGNNIASINSQHLNFPLLLDLDLSSNSLTGLPTSIINCTNLQRLILRNNKLTSLPQEFDKLNSLKELILTGNSQLQRVPSSVSNIPSLRFLCINSCNLTQIPISLSNLIGLKTLQVASNAIRVIPDQLCNLKYLSCFNCSHNLLTIIPASFSRLKDLQHIDAQSNQLVQIAIDFKEMPALNIVNFSHNFLKSLPLSLFQLSSLKELHLDNNQLFQGMSLILLKQLQILTIDHNELTELPMGISNLRQLQKNSFSCSHNRIGAISNSLCDSRHLSRVDISHNLLKELPNIISKLFRLQELDLSYNLFQVISLELKLLPNLKTLNLAHNQIAQIPQEFSPKLRRLDLSYNRYEQYSLDSYPQLQELNLAGNQIIQINGPLKSNTTMQKLSLADNKIGSLHLDLLNYKNIRELDVSGNHLTCLPDFLNGLQPKFSFIIEGNPIRAIQCRQLIKQQYNENAKEILKSFQEKEKDRFQR